MYRLLSWVRSQHTRPSLNSSAISLIMDLSRLTLPEWYEGTFVFLFHADARPGTIEQYRNTLAIWKRVSGDPPILDIDQLTLAKFRATAPGQAATVAKHARHLNHLLSKLGPPGPRNRDALDLLPRTPWCKPPRPENRKLRIPHNDELETFVSHAPLDLALFAVVAATTGSRNGAVRSLRRDNIDAAGQFVRFPAETDKKRGERTKPIPRITLTWLTKYARLMEKWARNPSNFAKKWNASARQCGTPLLRPHGLKRWWGATLVRAHASPWCIKFALDHAQNDVTGLHYLDSFDELAGLVDKIELPASFTTRLRTETQIELPW